MSGNRRRSVAGRRLSAAVLAPGVIALSLMVTATPSSAATKIFVGQTHENYFCNASDQWIQTASAGPSFVVPTGATTLTRWSTNGGIAAGVMQFELWDPAGGNDYTLVYISAPTTLGVSAITHVTVSPGIDVAAGDVIGYRAVTETDCALRTDKTADAYLYDPDSGTPTVGSTVDFQGPATGFRFNVAAELG